MSEGYPTDLAPSFQNPLPINPNMENIQAPKQIFTYKTPCNCINACIPITFFIMGFPIFVLMLVLGLSDNNMGIIFSGFVPLCLVIVSFILGSYFILYHSITIDQFGQFVAIKTIKLCFCFNKTNTIPFDQIGRVIVQIDRSKVYRVNNVTYEAFEIIFQLRDGTNIVGCSGILNQNNEGPKAMSILRSGLPQDIYLEGDFKY